MYLFSSIVTRFRFRKTCMYVIYVLDIYVYINEVILSFLPFCLVFIYHVAYWLMNAGSSNKKTNHEIRGKRAIFTGTSIYKREAVISRNIGLVARTRIYFNYRKRLFRLVDWSGLEPLGIRATAIYGRWPSSLCWKARWYSTYHEYFKMLIVVLGDWRPN